MALTTAAAENLVQQLQQAHRISVAFYRRILPSLDSIAEQLNCQFRNWEPLYTSLPSRKNSKPSDSWAWDYVPLFASNHVYLRVHGELAQASDVGLCLCLYVDDAFHPQQLNAHRINGEPDAVTLPIGKAVLQAWIYRPLATSELSFEELWADAADPVVGDAQFKVVKENMHAIALEWPLAEVMCDINPIVEKLKLFTL